MGIHKVNLNEVTMVIAHLKVAYKLISLNQEQGINLRLCGTLKHDVEVVHIFLRILARLAVTCENGFFL